MRYPITSISSLHFTGCSVVKEYIRYGSYCTLLTSWVGGDKNLIAKWLHNNIPALYTTMGNTTVYVADNFGYKWAYHFNWRKE